MYREVKVKLRKDVTSTDFWRATYHSDSNLGIRLVHNFDSMKKNYMRGRLYKYGSLEVSIPMSYYNKEKETIDFDMIDYGYIKDGKNIWIIEE